MRSRLCFCVAAFLAAGSAHGEVVLNNLAAVASPMNGFGVGFEAVAVKFTATESFDLFSDLKLNLQKYSAGSAGTFTVTLHANIEGSGTNAKPDGAVLATIGTGSWNSLSSDGGTFVQYTDVALGATRAAGNYWVAVTSSAPSSTQRWQYGASPSGQYLNAYFNGTSWANFSALPFLQNNIGASITTATAVPEPETLLLGGIAMLWWSGGVWWKRQRTAVGQSQPPYPEAIHGD